MIYLYYSKVCDENYNTKENSGIHDTHDDALKEARVMAACMSTRYGLCVLYDTENRLVEIFNERNKLVIL